MTREYNSDSETMVGNPDVPGRATLPTIGSTCSQSSFFCCPSRNTHQMETCTRGSIMTLVDVAR